MALSRGMIISCFMTLLVFQLLIRLADSTDVTEDDIPKDSASGNSCGGSQNQEKCLSPDEYARGCEANQHCRGHELYEVEKTEDEEASTDTDENHNNSNNDDDDDDDVDDSFKPASQEQAESDFIVMGH